MSESISSESQQSQSQSNTPTGHERTKQAQTRKPTHKGVKNTKKATTKQKTPATKRTQLKSKDFDKKSKEAALAQSKLAKAKQRQRQIPNSSRVQLDTSQFHKNKSIEVINMASDSSQGNAITIFTSNDPGVFMSTPMTKKPSNPERINRKIDKIISKISNSPKKKSTQDTEQLISIIRTDHSKPNEEEKVPNTTK